MRIQRDIPTYRTEAGVDKTNLRQYVAELQKERGVQCRCIRCREPRSKDFAEFEKEKIVVKKSVYGASSGSEIFLQAVDKKHDMLLGFCRLRIPFTPHELGDDSFSIHLFANSIVQEWISHLTPICIITEYMEK